MLTSISTFPSKANPTRSRWSRPKFTQVGSSAASSPCRLGRGQRPERRGANLNVSWTARVDFEAVVFAHGRRALWRAPLRRSSWVREKNQKIHRHTYKNLKNWKADICLAFDFDFDFSILQCFMLCVLKRATFTTRNTKVICGWAASYFSLIFSVFCFLFFKTK